MFFVQDKKENKPKGDRPMASDLCGMSCFFLTGQIEGRFKNLCIFCTDDRMNCLAPQLRAYRHSQGIRTLAT